MQFALMIRVSISVVQLLGILPVYGQTLEIATVWQQYPQPIHLIMNSLIQVKPLQYSISETHKWPVNQPPKTDDILISTCETTSFSVYLSVNPGIDCVCTLQQVAGGACGKATIRLQAY